MEIIIVDDASKDDTLSIIQNLQTKCKIKLISRQKAKGLGSAFQRAILESSENISWIDTNMGELSSTFPR